MNLASYLQRSAAAHPEAPAVLVGAELRLNYGQLAHRTAALAGYLREVLGVRPGDRVAIFAGNCLEYLEALHAILWAGAVSVPVNYKLHPKELEHVLADSGSCVLLVSEDLASGLTALSNPPGHVVVLGGDAYTHALSHAPAELVERSPHDLASLFYTSGTTGRPKGVMQTHLNLQAMTLCDIAEGFSTWKHLHLMATRRTFGGRPAYFGTEGIAWLLPTMNEIPFPELWSARGFIGDPPAVCPHMHK